jgi:hypothetical protein
MSNANIFDILTMNDPRPEVVLQNCFEAIDCIDSINPEQVDVKWVSPKTHCEFSYRKVDFVITYDTVKQQSELKMSVTDEIYQNYIAEQRKYPQYQNKTDSEIWPQSYTITSDFDPGRLSFAYEDISEMIPLDEKLEFIREFEASVA